MSSPAPERRPPVPVEQAREVITARAGRAAGGAVRELRSQAAGRGVAGPGAPRDAPRRPAGGRQGPAPEHRTARPRRPADPRQRGTARRAAVRDCARVGAHRSSRSSAAPCCSSSTTGSRPTTRAGWPRNLDAAARGGVPEVIRELSRQRVLTTEFVHGVEAQRSRRDHRRRPRSRARSPITRSGRRSR